MSGPRKKPHKIETIMLTPPMATKLLENNGLNRPLGDAHVKRIAEQITAGKWRFNGDTIKIADGGDVLDGQHRLWAVVESNTAIETIIVHGIEPDAFSTIDTIRRARSSSDVVALAGVSRNRAAVAGALTWLIRHQRNVLEQYREPENRVENADVEQALKDNPGIIRAVDAVTSVKGVANPALMGFAYYLVSNRDEELADRMVETMRNPGAIHMNDPFFKLRVFFLSDKEAARRRDGLKTIAVMFKAINAAAKGEHIARLIWQSQGAKPEPFPKLTVPAKTRPLRVA